MNAASHPTDDDGKMQAVSARRDLRRSQETRAKFWQAIVASSFVFVVVGASLFLGLVMVIGTFVEGGTNQLTVEGRTGRVARALRDGTLCHFIVFDNKTAQAVEDRIGRCDEVKPKPKAERPPTFSWGK